MAAQQSLIQYVLDDPYSSFKWLYRFRTDTNNNRLNFW